MRQFRFGIYNRDFDRIDESQDFLEEHCLQRLGNKSPAVMVAAEAFDPDWFGSLPGSMQFYLLNHVLRYSIASLTHYQPVIAYLEDERNLTVSPDEQVPFHRLLAGYYILQGRFEDLGGLLARHEDSFKASGFAGTLAFLQHDNESAFNLYKKDMDQLHEFFGGQEAFFFGLPGLFCVFSLLERNHPGDREAVQRHIAAALARFKDSQEEVPYLFVQAMVVALDNELPDMGVLTEHLKADNRSITRFLAVLCLYWMGVEVPADFTRELIRMHDRAAAEGFLWLAMESAFLLEALGVETEKYGPAAEKIRAQIGGRSIVSIAEPENSWKHSLQELISISSTVREQEKNVRLVWLVNFKDDSLHLLPKEQKRKASGSWSKGRAVSLSRLAESGNIEYLTEQDREICAALHQVGDPAGRNGGYVFDPEKALPALVGHPLVFLEKSPKTPVEIVAGEPELLVEQQDDFLYIAFTKDIGEGNVAVWQETPVRFKVIRIDDNHRRVAGITGRKGLRVPLSASRQVLDAIGKIASFMTVHSSVGVDIENQDVELVEADPTIHLHFIPYGSGFRLEMFVQPFPQGGPY
ncbi:MAG TPA: ATP-dependent helicase, partial [Desulfobacteraceae bacterium]|nr:ATP-dependent helicase [Desulfobacteraceae bacterium]